MRKSVVPRIDRAEERLWTLVQKTMEKACTGFDAPSYDAAVTAAITLSKVGADLARIWRAIEGARAAAAAAERALVAPLSPRPQARPSL
jgi:predicted naringenin-chalcone synthase